MPINDYNYGLELFFRRLREKHDEKGYSFANLSFHEMSEIVNEEFDEFYQAKDHPERINELLDLMVASLIFIQWLLKEVGMI